MRARVRLTLVSLTAALAFMWSGQYLVAQEPPAGQQPAGQQQAGEQQSGQQPGNQPAAAQPAAPDPIAMLVDRLDLEKYKATIKGLTQFGDRRQGTDRNRKAVDWIEAQLQSYGCTNTERIKYVYTPPPPRGRGAGNRGTGAEPAAGQPPAGGRAAEPAAEGAASDEQPTQRGRYRGPGPGGRIGRGQGGSTMFGYRGRTGVNIDPLAQPDEALRELNEEPTTPGPREEVFCTKVGTTRPHEMYIVGAHMDGHGWGQAANDDGSGTAIVMELARVFSSPDVQTDRSIRFILWNNEESGLNGARAYVAQRESIQGKEDPPASGKFPEPRWLGMIQHDMMLFDHGAPRADGTVSREQRLEADVNIEFQSNSKVMEQSRAFAFVVKAAGDKYTKDYPVAVGPHMTNTDSGPFQDLVPSISLRENERGAQIGAGWDPHWHQPTDVYTTYYDKDFLLGLNAAQTSLSALAQLTGAKIVAGQK